MLLKHTWIAWLKEFPKYCDNNKNDENDIILKPVEPLCNLKPAMLPKKLP